MASDAAIRRRYLVPAHRDRQPRLYVVGGCRSSIQESNLAFRGLLSTQNHTDSDPRLRCEAFPIALRAPLPPSRNRRDPREKGGEPGHNQRRDPDTIRLSRNYIGSLRLAGGIQRGIDGMPLRAKPGSSILPVRWASALITLGVEVASDMLKRSRDRM